MKTTVSHQSKTVGRREFVASCANSALAAACLASKPLFLRAGSEAQGRDDEKAKVRVVFTHIPSDKPTWPNRGYNYEARKTELLTKLRQACPYIDFLPATAQNSDEAKKLLEADHEVDGYMVYMVGIWTGAPAAIAASGRPTIFVDDLYAGSGEFLTAYAAAKRKGLKVAGVSSSRFQDVVQAVKSFDCLKRLRSSVILDVVERDPGDTVRAIRDAFGTTVKTVSAGEINEEYRKVDRAEAQKQAAVWIREAERVVEPSTAEIEKSAAMSIAMQELLRRNTSRAITIDCLTLLYGGKLPAYPCLGLFKLNNEGMVGACEADLPSTVTMLLMTYLVGRPGYISDPVIDTASNQIIYAHCVSTNRVFGPEGPSNPYHIRNHSEDRKGAVVRSLMPLGEVTTTLRFDPIRKLVVMHQGKTVANVDEDRACRTKLAAEVKDPFKLLTEWDRFGWHRVTFYGDLKQQVETISVLTGFGVVYEG